MPEASAKQKVWIAFPHTFHAPVIVYQNTSIKCGAVPLNGVT